MRSSTKNIVLIVAMSAAPMFAFQNCSQVQFAEMPILANEKADLVVDNGDASNVDSGNTSTVDIVIDEGDGSNTSDDTADNSTPPSDSNSDDSDSDSDDSSDNVVDNGSTPDSGSTSSDDNDMPPGGTTSVSDNEVPPTGDNDSDNDGEIVNASCTEGELTEAEAANDQIVQVACNGNSGKMCAMICFQPNDRNPFVLTKKVNLKQTEDGGAWENGPKANGRVANASSPE